MVKGAMAGSDLKAGSGKSFASDVSEDPGKGSPELLQVAPKAGESVPFDEHVATVFRSFLLARLTIG